MIELWAIACFVSPNPSSSQWVVSGQPADVRAIEMLARKLSAGRIVASATGEGVGFARIELPPHMKYGVFLRLVNEVQRRRLLYSFPPRPAIPDCKDGRAEDVDDVHADPVIVGIVGNEAKIDEIERQLPSVTFSTIRLNDGRTGVLFRPALVSPNAYSSFVSRAASGGIGGAAVVLLRKSEVRAR